jgi:hypothetical protein
VGEVDDKHTHPNPAMFAPIPGPEIKTSKLIDYLPNHPFIIASRTPSPAVGVEDVDDVN